MQVQVIDTTISVVEESAMRRMLHSDRASSRGEIAAALASARAEYGKRPGIYAFYGDDDAWDLIEGLVGGLPPGYRDLSRPMYIGVHNDIGGRLYEHLSLCRPDSTYRCSLIALTMASMQWKSIAPRYRTQVKPTDYRLGQDENALLNDWVGQHLRVAVWGSTIVPYRVFSGWEEQLIRELRPPLNVKNSLAPTRFFLQRARAACASEARRSPHMLRYSNGSEATVVPIRNVA